MKFKSEHPDIHIHQRAFEGLKPYFIKTLQEWNVCCCVYHVEMAHLRDAVNAMRATGCVLHSRGCDCPCLVCSDPGQASHAVGGKCGALRSTFNSTRQFNTTILCHKPDDQPWHSIDCILGKCHSCGVKKLQLCPREESAHLQPAATLRWKRFQRVDAGNDRSGAPKKRIKLVFLETHPTEMVDYLKKKVTYFVEHNFYARWQATQYRECMKHFPQDVVVSAIDFAENYGFAI